jgi:hypothetical protein
MRKMHKYTYDQDESLEDGTVIYWTQRERHQNSSGQYFFKVPIRCPDCGKVRPIQQSQMTMNRRRGTFKGVCQSCMGNRYVPTPKVGADSPFWKGGRYVHGSGYIMTHIPRDSPYRSMVSPSQRNKPYGTMPILEHRLVMAEHLGRPLESWEIVHHRDGNKQNNTINNLELMIDASTHNQITHLQKRVKALEEENAALRLQLSQQIQPPSSSFFETERPRAP